MTMWHMWFIGAVQGLALGAVLGYLTGLGLL